MNHFSGLDALREEVRRLEAKLKKVQMRCEFDDDLMYDLSCAYSSLEFEEGGLMRTLPWKS